MKNDLHDQVATYYGKTITSTNDLKTSACCTNIEYPSHIKQILSELHDETLSKYYGCGLTIPSQLDGLNVLDLGSGSGRDCFVLSKLVGEKGAVVGVDMTDEQLLTANTHIGYHAEKFGYSNVEFMKGHIEHLDQLGLPEASFDLIVSNCVVNLAFNKRAVLQGAFDLLKLGGEMYFSDVYADRRIPNHVANDPEVYGECLGGALYWNDFLNIAKSVGFTDPRAVSSDKIAIDDERIAKLVGNINFYSVTYRLMKLPALESDCEDYGQAVRYKGSIEFEEDKFILDDHHIFETGRIYTVCGNTYMMLHDTRFKDHFDFWGNFSAHYGIFEGCGGSAPFSTESLNAEGVAQCC
ncbi:MAG: methyltransferase domain-containing protein [bacterium]|nr:methyltransferase domain-containing protein [bacterium]